MQKGCCVVCKKGDCKGRCSKCRVVFYCSTECQKMGWKIHKKHCDDMKYLKSMSKNTSKFYVMYCMSDQKEKDLAFVDEIKSIKRYGIVWKGCGICLFEIPKEQEDYIRQRIKDLNYVLDNGVIGCIRDGKKEEFFLRGKNIWTIVN